MRTFIFALFGLLALSACTPADEEYCQSFGVTGNEFAKCIDYYHKEEAAFRVDRDVCELEADGTYPPTLYDNGHYEHVMGGFVPTPYGGRYVGAQTVYVGPDYYRNRQVDDLRMRIIQPCMQQHGWNSGATWKAGRRTVTKAKPAPAKKSQKIAPINALPWLQ